MDASNLTNGTNCSQPTVGKEKLIIAVQTTFSVVGVIFYATAILLIIKTAYTNRVFFYRLTIYLAVGGILHSMSNILQIIPVDVQKPDSSPVSVRAGWWGVCQFAGFMLQYVVFVQAFTIVWTCLYVFILVIYQKQYNHFKHEVAGVTTIILAPLLFTWEPFVTNSYGLLGTRCWIVDDNCDSGYDRLLAYQLTINIVPILLLSIVSVVLVVLAVLSLAKQKFIRKDLTLQHWQAIKELLPLTIYPLVYILIFFGRMIALVSDKYLNEVALAFTALQGMGSVALPFSLLIRSNVQKRLCRRDMYGEKEPLATSTIESAEVDNLS